MSEKDVVLEWVKVVAAMLFLTGMTAAAALFLVGLMGPLAW